MIRRPNRSHAKPPTVKPIIVSASRPSTICLTPGGSDKWVATYLAVTTSVDKLVNVNPTITTTKPGRMNRGMIVDRPIRFDSTRFASIQLGSSQINTVRTRLATNQRANSRASTAQRAAAAAAKDRDGRRGPRHAYKKKWTQGKHGSCSARTVKKRRRKRQNECTQSKTQEEQRGTGCLGDILPLRPGDAFPRFSELPLCMLPPCTVGLAQRQNAPLAKRRSEACFPWRA